MFSSEIAITPLEFSELRELEWHVLHAGIQRATRWSDNDSWVGGKETLQL